MEIEHPKVFISYSWTSPEYQKRVRRLATRLMEDGVDVTLDQWDLTPGKDLIFFMEKLKQSDKVLILCDKAYAEKADQRSGGVGIETHIITPEVYGDIDQEKFIPVIMEALQYVPSYLKGKDAVDFSIGHEEAGYKNLLHAIYGIPMLEKPKLGKKPDWLKPQREEESDIEYSNAELQPFKAKKKYSTVSAEAFVMLLYAAIYNGEIEHNKSIVGETFLVGGKYNMNKEDTPRENAKWEYAIEELASNDFIKYKFKRGSALVYSVTNQGYAVADRFRDSNGIDTGKTPSEILQWLNE